MAKFNIPINVPNIRNSRHRKPIPYEHYCDRPFPNIKPVDFTLLGDNGVETHFYSKPHWPGECAEGWNVCHNIYYRGKNNEMDMSKSHTFYTRECVKGKCDFSDCKYCFRLWKMTQSIK